MIEDGVVPDGHTFVAVLKATSKLGDVRTAADMIGYMKWYEVPMTEYIFNGLVKTYASACLIKNVLEEHIDIYLDDIWKLVD